jgi:peptide deformylase
MILEIKKYPDSVLRKKAEGVEKITEDVIKLSQDMIETMVNGDGIGLAANQVGELKRVIIINAGEGPEVFINPVIVWKSKEKELTEEGCLSFFKVYLKIKRPKEVEVEFLNIKGEISKIKARGLLACAFQHEIDHLDGILFIDRAGSLQKLKFKLFKK